MVFFAEEGAAGPAWWQWVVIVALPVLFGALGGLAVKVWPLLLKSAAARAAEARKAAAQQAREDQKQREQEARLRREAHEEVRQEYAEFFARQQAEIEVLRRDRDANNDRVRKLFDEMRAIDRAHADCLVKNERMATRVGLLEETIEAVRVAQGNSGVVTRNEAVIVCDDARVIREWSPACTAMFHWKSWEAIGREIDVIIPPEWRETCRRGFQAVLADDREARRGPFFVDALRKDGRLAPVEMLLSSWADDSGGRRRRMFSASLRQRAQDSHGRTAEDATPVGAMLAAPLPAGEALAAVRAAEAGAAADAGSVKVAPEPAGGATVHVPPGATAEVVKDDVRVEVRPEDGPAGPG